MNKKIVFMIGSGLLAAGLLVGCGHSTPEKKAAYIVEEIKDELKLQDNQLVKLNLLKDHVLSIHKIHKAEKKKAHKELRTLLEQPSLDQNAVLAHINAKTEMVNQKAPKVVALLGDFYDSLDHGQQAEIRKHVDKFSKHAKHWH